MVANDETAAKLFKTGDILKAVKCRKLDPSQMSAETMRAVGGDVTDMVDSRTDAGELDAGVCARHRFLPHSGNYSAYHLNFAMLAYNRARDTGDPEKLPTAREHLIKDIADTTNVICRVGEEPHPEDKCCPIENAKKKLFRRVDAANAMNIPDYEQEHRGQVALYDIRKELYD